MVSTTPVGGRVSFLRGEYTQPGVESHKFLGSQTQKIYLASVPVISCSALLFIDEMTQSECESGQFQDAHV